MCPPSREVDGTPVAVSETMYTSLRAHGKTSESSLNVARSYTGCGTALLTAFGGCRNVAIKSPPRSSRSVNSPSHRLISSPPESRPGPLIQLRRSFINQATAQTANFGQSIGLTDGKSMHGLLQTRSEN
uniref:Uncharacterized protein n=1 Tax=Anopheles farauti TaxID=69004 RepID=A0A182Q884_9DIPT